MAEDLVLLRQSVWGAHASPRALFGETPNPPHAGGVKILFVFAIGMLTLK